MERGRNATRSSRDDDGGKTKATTSGDEKSGAIVGNISGDSKKSLDKRKRKYSRSRSRSRSLSSHSSSLSNSSSESELISASSDSESNSLLSSGNEDERRRRKKKSKKESVKDKKKSKKSRDKEKKKEKKDKKDKKDKKKKKIRKDKKTKKKTSGAGSIADSWGSHGIITSAEMYTKEAEFRSWLIEIKHISPEDRNSKQYFEEFVEDFNTATLPHEKYYNMDAWDRRMLISNQYADGTGGGTGSGGGGLEFDFARDEQLLKQQQRNAKMSRLPEVSMSTDELRDLKRIQDERLEAEKLKKLGFKPKDSMGVRKLVIMDRTQKLASLKKQREEAVKANRKDVHREHVRIKYRQTQADETRAAKTRRTAEILALRVEAEEKGEDYERQRALGYSAEAVERYEEKEEEKRRRAEGAVFADFAQAAANKYTKLTDALAREHNNTTTANNNKPYADAALVAHVASAIASSSSSTSLNSSIDPNAAAYAALANVPSKLAVSKLVKDLEKQAEARKTFSKRRAHDPDADVTYINERNMRFNKKIARAYDKHTAEIKQAFERGTAL